MWHLPALLTDRSHWTPRGPSERIGWHPTGPVTCSACGTEVFAECTHLPGDRLESGDVVEFVFTDAELVETSAVSVPAVQGTGIDQIRAALSAARIHTPKETPRVFSQLLGRLGLTDVANEQPALDALGRIEADRDEARRALAAARFNLRVEC